MAKRRIRIFLDSNVILSGLFSDKGAPRIILDLLCLNLPFLSGMTGEYNLIEVERNLKNKLPEALPIYHEYLPKLGLEIIPMPHPDKVLGIKGHIHRKDVPVYVSAVIGEADFLVTGDKKGFIKVPRKPRAKMKIVTPAEFVQKFLPEILRRIIT